MRSKLNTIGSDNGLSPCWRQAIIWTNAGILLIRPIGTNFNEIAIQIYTFSIKQIYDKNVVWNLAAILSRYKYAKIVSYYDGYLVHQLCYVGCNTHLCLH